LGTTITPIAVAELGTQSNNEQRKKPDQNFELAQSPIEQSTNTVTSFMDKRPYSYPNPFPKSLKEKV